MFNPKTHKWTALIASPATFREKIEDRYLGGTQHDTLDDLVGRLRQMIPFILTGYILTDPGKLEFALPVPIWADTGKVAEEVSKELRKGGFDIITQITKRVSENTIFYTCTYETFAMSL